VCTAQHCTISQTISCTISPTKQLLNCIDQTSVKSLAKHDNVTELTALNCRRYMHWTTNDTWNISTVFKLISKSAAATESSPLLQFMLYTMWTLITVSRWWHLLSCKKREHDFCEWKGSGFERDDFIHTEAACFGAQRSRCVQDSPLKQQKKNGHHSAAMFTRKISTTMLSIMQQTNTQHHAWTSAAKFKLEKTQMCNKFESHL